MVVVAAVWRLQRPMTGVGIARVDRPATIAPSAKATRAPSLQAAALSGLFALTPPAGHGRCSDGAVGRADAGAGAAPTPRMGLRRVRLLYAAARPDVDRRVGHAQVARHVVQAEHDAEPLAHVGAQLRAVARGLGVVGPCIS